MDTNLRGAFFVAQGAARVMKESGGGSIVNIASILALRVAGNVAPYAIAKAGLAQMTQALALEWARYNIRVNALAPGYLETELNADFFASPAGQALIKRIPQRRLSRLTDLDAPLLLLAGDAAPTLTGVVLPVDGGHLVSSL
jgi:NAD(P)-dependent dehydrogenase (short-subunit alcohol dehydrogenase family)